MTETITCDVAIVGGGLAGGLIALALARKRPDLDVRIFETAESLGGNHIWSFFASDIDDANRWLVAPLIGHGWVGYDVRYPDHARTLDTRYYSIESERLEAVVRAKLPPERIMTGTRVLGVSPRAVVLPGGRRVKAHGVIDARGPGDLRALKLGWQKFVGRELILSNDHALTRPIVKDATVKQIDGYRFIYSLPLTATRVFVEDTYYSDTPQIDARAINQRIDAYAAEQGWEVEAIGREESGVLPVALGGDFEAYWRSTGEGIAKAGMRAALFHPTTGYSLPDAVRTAVLVAGLADLSGAALHDALLAHARTTWKARGFYRMLDKMLFRAAAPDQRYLVLERFYRLNPGLIGRFYAGRSTLLDQARILSGKPPVPVGRAVAALLEK